MKKFVFVVFALLMVFNSAVYAEFKRDEYISEIKKKKEELLAEWNRIGVSTSMEFFNYIEKQNVDIKDSRYIVCVYPSSTAVEHVKFQGTRAAAPIKLEVFSYPYWFFYESRKQNRLKDVYVLLSTPFPFVDFKNMKTLETFTKECTDLAAKNKKSVYILVDFHFPDFIPVNLFTQEGFTPQEVKDSAFGIKVRGIKKECIDSKTCTELEKNFVSPLMGDSYLETQKALWNRVIEWIEKEESLSNKQ